MTTTTPPATAAPAQPAQTKALTHQDQKRLTLRKLFEHQKPELSKLLPRGMDPDRLFRMALTECVKNPRLLECSAESWALAMQTCASQGLYPDSGLGYMYLIPRNNSKQQLDKSWKKVMEVTAQRGYQGDIALARKTGEIETIYAEVVYQKDHYKVTKGLARNIEHVPYEGDEDPGPLRACYAVAKLRSGELAWVTLTKRDVMRHKASAQRTEEDDSPWKQHEAAMWRKTAIHELFKWLPKSSEEMEKVARTISEEKPIDTTAVDLGQVELPSEGGAKPALDTVADQLAAAAGEASSAPTADCAHPSVPPSKLGPGKTVVCPDCGEELKGEDREPGSDDGDEQPAAIDPRAAVEALAQKAGPTDKPRPRQGRLHE